MKSLVSLKEKNENLSRELAESCRKYVDLTFEYAELKDKWNLQTKAFKRFVILCEKNITEKEVEEKIASLMENAYDPIQLNLPIKLENDI